MNDTQRFTDRLDNSAADEIDEDPWANLFANNEIFSKMPDLTLTQSGRAKPELPVAQVEPVVSRLADGVIDQQEGQAIADALSKVTDEKQADQMLKQVNAQLKKEGLSFEPRESVVKTPGAKGYTLYDTTTSPKTPLYDLDTVPQESGSHKAMVFKHEQAEKQTNQPGDKPAENHAAEINKIAKNIGGFGVMLDSDKREIEALFDAFNKEGKTPADAIKLINEAIAEKYPQNTPYKFVPVPSLIKSPFASAFAIQGMDGKVNTSNRIDYLPSSQPK